MNNPKFTRGKWFVTPSGIENRYDVLTNESEGTICQNARVEDAFLIAAAKKMYLILKSVEAQCNGVTVDSHEFRTALDEVLKQVEK